MVVSKILIVYTVPVILPVILIFPDPITTVLHFTVVLIVASLGLLIHCNVIKRIAFCMELQL